MNPARARTASGDCAVLAVACLVTHWLATNVLGHLHSLGRDDDLLGGMWAVLATIFVLRDSFRLSVAAAVSRMAATTVSFALCLICLAFLPFHAWALALLAGLSALVVTLLGRMAAAHPAPGGHRDRRRRRSGSRLGGRGPGAPFSSAGS